MNIDYLPDHHLLFVFQGQQHISTQSIIDDSLVQKLVFDFRILSINFILLTQ